MADAKQILVLVADDEPSTRALVSNHMRKKGFAVIEAVDGDEAWSLAQQHLPELIVLDVMMPGMSGWEVCRRIREAVSLAHTGVVMLTGIGENLNELTSPLYGADAYIDKPFEFADLDVKVRDTLSRRRAGALGRPDGADVRAPSGVPESVLPPTEPPASTLKAPRLPSRKPGSKPAAPSRPVQVEKALPAKAPPAKALPAKAPPAKALPKKAPPAKAPPAKAPPKKALPKKALPKKAPSKKALPKKTPSKKTLPKKTLPKKALPKKALPKKALPKKALPKKALPKKALPKKAPSKKAPPKKPPPKKAPSKKPPPGKARR
jgi:CheY-like chemotaxis protein